MNLNILIPYVQFFYRNYLRSHRYLREIVLIVIFHIFFWGFLYSPRPEAEIWTVFAVLGILLNITTVSSLFFLEKGNSLYFVLVRPRGRLYFFLAKTLLIFLIDFFWVLLFSLIYGLRFLDPGYFLHLPLQLTLMALLLILSTLILSLSYTYKPGIAWLLLILIVFGSIINKTPLFPPDNFKEIYVFLTLALPPFLELIMSAVTLHLTFWQFIFLGVAIAQIFFYFILNYRLILKKDFV